MSVFTSRSVWVRSSYSRITTTIRVSSVLPRRRRNNHPPNFLWQCRRHFPLVPPPWERKPHYSIAEACDLILQQEGHDFYKLSYEVNVNLNVDPRLGGDQIIKGVFELPHPTNKKNFRVIALTTDPDLALLALQAGALYAGDLGDLLTEEFLCTNRIKMVIATQELENAVVRKSKRKCTKLSKVLRRLHLTPEPEFCTLVPPEAFIESVRRFVLGTYTRFQNDLHGNIAIALGKVGTHTPPMLAENFYALLQTLYAQQPAHFNIGERGRLKNEGKFIIGAHLNVMGVDSFPLDLQQLLTSLFAYRNPGWTIDAVTGKIIRDEIIIPDPQLEESDSEVNTGNQSTKDSSTLDAGNVNENLDYHDDKKEHEHQVVKVMDQDTKSDASDEDDEDIPEILANNERSKKISSMIKAQQDEEANRVFATRQQTDAIENQPSREELEEDIDDIIVPWEMDDPCLDPNDFIDPETGEYRDIAEVVKNSQMTYDLNPDLLGEDEDEELLRLARVTRDQGSPDVKWVDEWDAGIDAEDTDIEDAVDLDMVEGEGSDDFELDTELENRQDIRDKYKEEKIEWNADLNNFDPDDVDLDEVASGYEMNEHGILEPRRLKPDSKITGINAFLDEDDEFDADIDEDWTVGIEDEEFENIACLKMTRPVRKKVWKRYVRYYGEDGSDSEYDERHYATYMDPDSYDTLDDPELHPRRLDYDEANLSEDDEEQSSAEIPSVQPQQNVPVTPIEILKEDPRSSHTIANFEPAVLDIYKSTIRFEDWLEEKRLNKMRETG